MQYCSQGLINLVTVQDVSLEKQLEEFGRLNPMVPQSLKVNHCLWKIEEP